MSAYGDVPRMGPSRRPQPSRGAPTSGGSATYLRVTARPLCELWKLNDEKGLNGEQQAETGTRSGDVDSSDRFHVVGGTGVGNCQNSDGHLSWKESGASGDVYHVREMFSDGSSEQIERIQGQLEFDTGGRTAQYIIRFRDTDGRRFELTCSENPPEPASPMTPIGGALGGVILRRAYRAHLNLPSVAH